jgi:Rieske 2Fe-2S family protein
MDEQMIADAVVRQKAGYTLEQAFYRDQGIYARDVESIFLKSWIYAGHSSEIPNVGDYFLLSLADESVIIIRSSADEMSALINVCRHRGSRVCTESHGCESRLVCRYHGWTYGLDGELKGAAHMPATFDRSGLSLKKVQLRSLHGLMFVNFAAETVPFDHIVEDLAECLKPYALEGAKVARRQNYPIAANWKLAVENYCECYHCAPAHPEYSRGHGLALPPGKYDAALKQVMARALGCGLSDKSVDHLYRSARCFGADSGYDRYPLIGGHLTGSRDGKPVAPLLGSIRDYDGGATDFQIGPITYALAYCDHVVIYRFTPLSAAQTECDITWLVNGDAEEGKDYDVNELTWLWDVTTIADQHIIERNQAGVNSRFYEPGPYSLMEDFTARFVDWYLETIK